MLHTLMTKIGPTALTSYAYSKDDFCTLANVVSANDQHNITFGVIFRDSDWLIAGRSHI